MKKIVKWILIVLSYVIVFNLKSCIADFGYDTSVTKMFTSEDGQTTVTVKQDFVSRPFVFYDGELVYSYSGSGFMENVFWSVTFVDRDTIILESKQFDEYYEIELR